MEVKPHAYFHCAECDLRFLDPALRLSSAEEKARYEFHENSAQDAGYRQFLEPVFLEIEKHLPKSARILDFGAGPGPALVARLRESGFTRVELYDPFFWPDESVLREKFDGIFATEVIEHLHVPRLEFARLRNLLVPGGRLILMTYFYDESLDFNSWYYRTDPTHVSFYSHRTLEWIREKFGFWGLEYPHPRVAAFTVP